jgi:hypothetical protein
VRTAHQKIGFSLPGIIMPPLVALIGILLTLLGLGCFTYAPKVAPFKLLEACANVLRVAWSGRFSIDKPARLVKIITIILLTK